MLDPNFEEHCWDQLNWSSTHSGRHLSSMNHPNPSALHTLIVKILLKRNLKLKKKKTMKKKKKTVFHFPGNQTASSNIYRYLYIYSEKKKRTETETETDLQN